MEINMSDPTETQETQEKPKSKKQRLIKVGIGIGIGALLGFGYYYFIGCNTGSCPITSSPYISTAYGAVFGLVVSAT